MQGNHESGNDAPKEQHYERISNISNISPSISPNKFGPTSSDRGEHRLRPAGGLEMIEEARGIEASEDYGNDEQILRGDLHHEMKMQVDQSQILVPIDNAEHHVPDHINPSLLKQ